MRTKTSAVILVIALATMIFAMPAIGEPLLQRGKTRYSVLYIIHSLFSPPITH